MCYEQMQNITGKIFTYKVLTATFKRILCLLTQTTDNKTHFFILLSVFTKHTCHILI